ncbi:MAG: carbonic anhydrase [Trueperaceae bacterium]|nr:carbonic anhydrase [Trueperaceae bacterium]
MTDASPAAALAALREGNDRFAAGRAAHPRQDPDRRAALRDGQRPFAAVLSCADSRVPPELIFDQGLGDLFTVRVAGHVLGEDARASLHFAVHELRVPLVVVLGHERCGAVGLAVDALRDGGDASAPLVRDIAPAARACLHEEDPVEETVWAHVRATAGALREDDAWAGRIAEGALAVHAAVYRLGAGRVEDAEAG